ncbi:putative N-acetyltransferase YhbS [Kribbella antiqua]|uniref:Putative N-acetyltransferase YhbS n=1 Tax=Kribbella antiqua TaxID=2512217 RepID=A0A4R2I5M9_9ACTN|nr:N-acetyltransferase [Kribbella antiqua]TCO37805.1 putative N-acetyltransferase YhbS [Kribbella antiqua]
MSITWQTRLETTEDITTIRELTRQAFGRQFEVDFLDAHRAEPAAWLPGLSLVATTADGEVVAHALITRCHIGETPVASLGPVAVLPPYQNQGAGSAVVFAALDAARDRGEQTVVVLGHENYYPRFGFRQATAFGVHHPQFDGPNLMALSLNGTPIPTGTLRYPVNLEE